jgi:hypothetical protein
LRPRRTKNSWFDSDFWPGTGGGVAVFRIDEDQVDVGRHVQFAAAVLAHRQHHHLLGPAGFLAERHAVQGGHLVHQIGQVGLDREIGEAAHRGDDFGEVGAAVEVALDDGADEQVAQAAHGASERKIAVRAVLGLPLQRCAKIDLSQR